jgi:hypothetical protein
MGSPKPRPRSGRQPHSRRRTRRQTREGTHPPLNRLARAAAYATIVGALLAATTLAIALTGSAHNSSHQAPRPAILQPLSLVVEQAKDKPSVQVIIHNLGSERSIVTEVRTHILAEERLILCGSQGELDLSGHYTVLLPATPSPGQVIATPLHEQLAGDEADRFSLAFAAVGQTSVKEFELPQRVYVYQLGLSLIHDAQRAPVRLGKVVLAVPALPRVNEYFLTAEDTTPAFRKHMTSSFGSRFYGEYRACYRHNGLALERMLALPGARDPALTAATSHLVLSP